MFAYCQIGILLFLLFSHEILGKVLEESHTSDKGKWELWEKCPEGSYVKGLSIRFNSEIGIGSLRFHCREGVLGKSVGYFDLNIIQNEDLLDGWRKPIECEHGVVTGVQLLKDNSGDHTSRINNVALICSDEELLFFEHEEQSGIWSSPNRCNAQEAICGAQSEVTEGSRRSLESLSFDCCRIPNPASTCQIKEKLVPVAECDNKDSEFPLTCGFKKRLGLSYYGRENERTIYKDLGFDMSSAETVLAEHPEFKSRNHHEFMLTNLKSMKETFTADPGTKITVSQVIAYCSFYKIHTPFFKKNTEIYEIEKKNFLFNLMQRDDFWDDEFEDDGMNFNSEENANSPQDTQVKDETSNIDRKDGFPEEDDWRTEDDQAENAFQSDAVEKQTESKVLKTEDINSSGEDLSDENQNRKSSEDVWRNEDDDAVIFAPVVQSPALIMANEESETQTTRNKEAEHDNWSDETEKSEHSGEFSAEHSPSTSLAEKEGNIVDEADSIHGTEEEKWSDESEESEDPFQFPTLPDIETTTLIENKELPLDLAKKAQETERADWSDEDDKSEHTIPVLEALTPAKSPEILKKEDGVDPVEGSWEASSAEWTQDSSESKPLLPSLTQIESSEQRISETALAEDKEKKIDMADKERSLPILPETIPFSAHKIRHDSHHKAISKLMSTEKVPEANEGSFENFNWHILDSTHSGKDSNPTDEELEQKNAESLEVEVIQDRKIGDAISGNLREIDSEKAKDNIEIRDNIPAADGPNAWDSGIVDDDYFDLFEDDDEEDEEEKGVDVPHSMSSDSSVFDFLQPPGDSVFDFNAMQESAKNLTNKLGEDITSFGLETQKAVEQVAEMPILQEGKRVIEETLKAAVETAIGYEPPVKKVQEEVDGPINVDYPMEPESTEPSEETVTKAGGFVGYIVAGMLLCVTLIVIVIFVIEKRGKRRASPEDPLQQAEYKTDGNPQPLLTKIQAEEV